MSKEITISVNTGKSVDTTKDLRKEIRELKNEFYSLEEGTERYNEVFQELSNKTLELKDRNEALRFSAQDLGQQIGNVIKVTRGLTSGFEVVQGTMALFGGQSEQLEKIMVKLQAAISIVQGLEGLEGLTKSIPALMASFGNVSSAVTGLIGKLGALKAAMVATGVGAIAVALGAVIANWDKISNMWTQEQTLDNLKEDLTELNGELEKNAKLLKIDEHEAHQRYRQAIIDSRGDVEKMAEAERKLKEELQGVSRELLVANRAAAIRKESEAYQEYIDSVTGLKAAFISSARKKELADAFTQIKNARLDAERALEEYDLEAASNKVKAESEANQKILEDKKNAYDTYLSDLDAKLKSYGLKGIGDDAFIPNQERLNEGLETLKAALNAKLITEEQYLMAEQQLREKYNNGSNTYNNVLPEGSSQAFNQALNEQFNKQLQESLREQGKMTEDAIKNVMNNVYATQQKYTAESQDEWVQWVAVGGSAMQALNNLADEHTEAYKASAILKAVIDGILAVQNVIATTPTLTGKLAAGAIIGSTTAANVLAIIRATKDNAASEISNTPRVSATMLPADVLGTTLASNNEIEMQAETAKNTRVYVLESDIANATNSVKTKVDESRF